MRFEKDWFSSLISFTNLKKSTIKCFVFLKFSEMYHGIFFQFLGRKVSTWFKNVNQLYLTRTTELERTIQNIRGLGVGTDVLGRGWILHQKWEGGDGGAPLTNKHQLKYTHQYKYLQDISYKSLHENQRCRWTILLEENFSKFSNFIFFIAILEKI